MKIIKTEIEGLLIIKPKVFEDNRGYFFESWSKTEIENAGLDINFVQDNNTAEEEEEIVQKNPISLISETKVIEINDNEEENEQFEARHIIFDHVSQNQNPVDNYLTNQVPEDPRVYLSRMSQIIRSHKYKMMHKYIILQMYPNHSSKISLIP